MKIVFATNNEHKLGEARKLAGDRIEILSLADIGCHEELPENGTTLEENSSEKARYVKEKYGYNCFSDDTGLFVDALDGRPGVFTARYAGQECDPDANIDKLLGELEGKDDRTARFRTVVTLCCDNDLIPDQKASLPEALSFEGSVEGSIAKERQGNGGFGYDPVFIPDETGISFAEMSPEAKNAVSHRGKALSKMFETMKKYILLLLTAVMAAFGAKAELTADWMVHMPFDSWPNQIIETPGRVYFTARTFEDNTAVPQRSTKSHSLFYYDKAGDEIISINKRTNASGNAVAIIGYNAKKKYLLVVYTDCNIDFIYDDGRTFNVPALMTATVPGKKEANSISFDNANNRAYIATSFGYVTLNDEKHEVAESRIYGENIKDIARCGNNVVILKADGLFHAPASSQRFNIDDYIRIDGAPEAEAILPLDGQDFITYKKLWKCLITRFSPASNGYKWEELANETDAFYHQNTPAGYTIAGQTMLYLVGNDGKLTKRPKPASETYIRGTSLNGSELWTLEDRKGIRSFKYNEGSNAYALSRDYMRPNSPATYMASSVAYHPTYGILAGSNGIDMSFNEFNQQTPDQVSALKGGFWKELSPIYGTRPIANDANYYGLAIDPNNQNHLYRGSVLGGLIRINLSNPADVLIMAHPKNQNSGDPRFVKVAEILSAWSQMCRFSTPQFSADGTMWTLYNNADMGRDELWYWSAADRAASTSAANFRPMKKISIPEFPNGNADVMTTLNVNKNMVAIAGFEDGGYLMIYDHKGTPDNTSDDRYVMMHTPYDQDGGAVSFIGINAVAEDPATGLLWIMSQRGLFTLNPATVFENRNQVNRIKVARNDGTNLADYLLNEINVNHMCIDGENRKWFSTSDGLVCTSQDGKSILAEFTADNSYLPSNNVLCSAYNPENKSLLVATDGGLVEMFPSGSGGSTDGGDAGFRAYPNPVEPDYYGWVRIDNLTDGSLVKITDAKGGLVKELGPAQGGSVEWDVSGLNHNRVSTGVYYIMVSPGANGGNTQISKILVLN